jgi:carbonic anhydrase
MENKKPNTLFICCCDHRVLPYKITSKKPGDLFILRNIGNIVPPCNTHENSVGAAIEYAVGQLEVTEIIVCGHSDCGGMKAVVKNSEKTSHLKNWLKYAAPTNGVSLPDELSKINVKHQIKNLMTYPVVKKRVDEATLKIHGWWIDLDTNKTIKGSL